MDHRADLNGLRGLSVLLVLAYHLGLKGSAGGYLGVDVFFVISGYLITAIVWRGLAAGDFELRRFLVARVRRIVPALVALVAVLMLVGLWGLPPFDLRVVGEQVAWLAVFLSNEHFAATSGYNVQSSGTRWLLHTWSLSVEAQFYLLYPLWLMAVAAVARRLGGTDHRTLRRALLGGVLALIAASLAWQATRLSASPDASFFGFPSRAWELLAGGVAALWPAAPAGPPGRARRLMSHAGLALVLATIAAVTLWRLRPVGLGAIALPLVAGVALMLWADHREHPGLRMRWLQAVGTRSYSLYLWHWPIHVGLKLSPLGTQPPAAVVAATLLLTALATWASYRWIERPFMMRGATTAAARADRPRASGWRPLAALALCGLAGVGLVRSDGLALRDPAGHAAYRDHLDSIEALYYPRRCDNFRKPVAAMTVCTIERDPRRRVLLIGDSHAEHYYAWFAARSAVSVDVFAASECPPVPGFERMQPGYHCRDYAARAWEMARSGRYDTVVVSARWATVGLLGPPYCEREDHEACRFPQGADKQRRVMDALRGAVDRTLAAGRTVVLLDGAPAAAARVPEQIARERYWYGQVRLRASLATLRAETAWIEPLLAELATRPGVHRLSLNERLCDARDCRVFDEVLGRPVFIDDSHFDPVWIAGNADMLLPFVQSPRAP